MQQQIIVLDFKKKGRIPDEGTPPLSGSSSDLCLQPACCQGGGCETVSIWKSRLLFACTRMCCCVHGLVCICVFGIKNYFLRSAQTGALRAPTRRESVNRGFAAETTLLFFHFFSFTLAFWNQRLLISPFSSLICAVRRCVAAPGLRSSDLCPAAEAQYCIISTWHYDRDQRLMMWIRQEPDIGPRHVLNLRGRRLEPGLITLLIMPRRRSCKQEYLRRGPLYTH